MFPLLILSLVVTTTYGSAPALIEGNSAVQFSFSDKHVGCIDTPTFDLENGWCAADNTDANSYLQVDLGELYDIHEVGTRARGIYTDGKDYQQWVKKYTLKYSATTADDSAFINYGELQGNIDSTNEAIRELSPAITARYLRFIPLNGEYNNHKSMRLEAYGVPESTHCNVIDIDLVLAECSDAFKGINERIDNVVKNAETFWANDPSAARVRRGDALVGDWMDISDKINQNYLIQLSLLLNVLIIIVGTCICVRAGVCRAFIAGGKQPQYHRVKYFTETDDENISIIHNKNNK